MTLLSNPPSPQTTTKTSKQHLTILPQNPVASKRKKIPTYPIKLHFKADNQAHLHSVITPQQRYHIRLSSNYKIIPMRVLPTLVLLLLALAVAQEEACGCLNGGRCLPGKDQRCVCREGFLGRQCRLPAQELTDKAAPASLSNEYRYFYFAPKEVNYYRLSFTLCMQENPSRRGTLFYVETERNDGSLRETPSMFEIAKIQLQEQSCTTFSTHYISIKRRDDESFRKIVIGLRAVQQGEDEKKYGAFLRYGQQEQQQVGKEKDNKNGYEQFSQDKKNTPSKQLNQQITIKMTTEVYLQTSNFSTFLILFTAFVLLILLTAFITYVRRKYTLDSLQLQLDSLHLQADLNRLRRELHSLNPEDPRPHTKNSLHNLEIFMPVTHYGTPQSIFIPHLLTNKEKHQEPLQAETCSICLLQFQTGDEIRTTPCSHQYHRECIDNWCQTRLSCPICRRQLDFTREVRQLYYELLRNELSI